MAIKRIENRNEQPSRRCCRWRYETSMRSFSVVILVIMALGFHDWKLTSRRFAAYAMSFAFMDGRFLWRGNHDYGFSDERLEQLTGGCRVHDGLVYFHNKAKVTVCHGHILGLSKTLDLVRTANNVNHMLAQFREDLLDKELQPSVIAYDIANMIEAALARQGLRLEYRMGRHLSISSDVGRTAVKACEILQSGR